MGVNVGDIGTVIDLDTGESLAGAANLMVFYTTPGGVAGEWTAEASGNAIRYTTTDGVGTFTEEGAWSLQGYLELDGWKGTTSIVTLTIGPRLYTEP